jgi:septal ring factor EnvC (AmiA/AmiB activator)
MIDLRDTLSNIDRDLHSKDAELLRRKQQIDDLNAQLAQVESSLRQESLNSSKERKALSRQHEEVSVKREIVRCCSFLLFLNTTSYWGRSNFQDLMMEQKKSSQLKRELEELEAEHAKVFRFAKRSILALSHRPPADTDPYSPLMIFSHFLVAFLRN